MMNSKNKTHLRLVKGNISVEVVLNLEPINLNMEKFERFDCEAYLKMDLPKVTPVQKMINLNIHLPEAEIDKTYTVQFMAERHELTGVEKAKVEFRGICGEALKEGFEVCVEIEG
jgi:hypothetical protein